MQFEQPKVVIVIPAKRADRGQERPQYVGLGERQRAQNVNATDLGDIVVI